METLSSAQDENRGLSRHGGPRDPRFLEGDGELLSKAEV